MPGSSQISTPAAIRSGYRCLERRRRLLVVRRLGDDKSHSDSTARCGEHPLDHVAVRHVRVHHVEATARAVDLLADRLRRRDEAAGDHLSDGDRRLAGVRRLREVPRQVVRQRAAVAAEAGQERRLRLPYDVAGDPDHHVVEAAVLEVVLDARTSRPGDRPVDDVQLPVVGATDLVLSPVEVPVVREEPVPVDREHVVDDDLRPGIGEAREHLPRLLVGPGAEPVDDHPHLDALVRASSRAAPPAWFRPRPRATRT